MNKDLPKAWAPVLNQQQATTVTEVVLPMLVRGVAGTFQLTGGTTVTLTPMGTIRVEKGTHSEQFRSLATFIEHYPNGGKRGN